MSSHRDLAIIGLGTFGTALARELTLLGDRVVGLDLNRERVALLADELSATIEADAANLKSLEQCSMESFDAVVISIGEDLESSILATMNALELGCKKVWVKAQTELQRKILKRLGAHHVVLPEVHYGAYVAQMVRNQHLRDYVLLGDGQYLAYIAAPRGLAGYTVAELENYGVTCVGRWRGGSFESGHDVSESIAVDDRFVLLGSGVALTRLGSKLDRYRP